LRSNHTFLLRKKIAREAALLLYDSQEKEFRQAKLKAAKAIGARVLPSNLEVALELDRLADEYEGVHQRGLRLTRMRTEALEIMSSLRDFNPKVIGSVWRGTAHRNSDIDIVVFSQNFRLVLDHLNKSGFKITRTERVSTTIKGEAEEPFHIYLNLPSGDEAEVTVRKPETLVQEEICQIYGDIKKGLSLDQLGNVLREEATRRFLPSQIKA